MDIESTFLKATEHVKTLSALNNDNKLEFYALFKYVKDGSCKTSKPSSWNVVESAKWQKWNDLGAVLTKNEAKINYINLVKKFDPSFQNEILYDVKHEGVLNGGGNDENDEDSDVIEEETNIEEKKEIIETLRIGSTKEIIVDNRISLSRSSSVQSVNQLLQSKVFPEWVPDHEAVDCFSCHKVFSAMTRKHHCRLCGNIFCNKCSKYSLQIFWAVPTYSIRICVKCNEELHNESSIRSEMWKAFSEEERLKAERRITPVKGKKSSSASPLKSILTPPVSAAAQTRIAWESIEYDTAARAKMGKGTLYIELLCAEDLPIGDLALLGSGGSSDPFVKLKVGVQLKTSSVIYKNLNPQWNEEFTITNISGTVRYLHVNIFDKDVLGSDFLAGLSVPLYYLADGNKHLDWWQLTSDKEFLKACGKSRFTTTDIASTKNAIVSPQILTPNKLKGRILLGLKWESKPDDQDELITSKLLTSFSRLNYHFKYMRVLQRFFSDLQTWENIIHSVIALSLWMLLCVNMWAFPVVLHFFFLFCIFIAYVRNTYAQSPSLRLILNEVLSEDEENHHEEDNNAVKEIFNNLSKTSPIVVKKYLQSIQISLEVIVSSLDYLEALLTWEDKKKTTSVCYYVLTSAAIHCFVPIGYTLSLLAIGLFVYKSSMNSKTTNLLVMKLKND